jgi:hypothetical protein
MSLPYLNQLRNRKHSFPMGIAIETHSVVLVGFFQSSYLADESSNSLQFAEPR